LVGAQFAARFHISSLSKLRGLKADVVAVASKTGQSAAAFAKAWDIPEQTGDYRRLLERRDIDVIDLCVPTDLHEQFCIEAAQAGKHIICEKPLTGYFGKGRAEACV
jgi:predicted dehydrogenase